MRKICRKKVAIVSATIAIIYMLSSFQGIAASNYSTESNPAQLEQIISEHSNCVEYKQTSDVEELKELIQKCEDQMAAAHAMAEGGRGCGYPEEHIVIQLAKQEWHAAHTTMAQWEEDLEELNLRLELAKYEEKACKYPEATYIWTYFKGLGYSDYICAGILGNIMEEVGGGTLAIQPCISSGKYYGICQWNTGYYNIKGASLVEQCNYLEGTLQSTIDTFGYLYYKGFQYKQFISLNDSSSAALAFAKIYERCKSTSYTSRQKNAIAAYNYFVN